MLYLEDYLEMIEHLPQELRDRFTEMRELDLTVQNSMDVLEKKQRSFFLQCKRGELQDDGIEQEFQNLRKEYYKVMEDADEKVNIATQSHELVERYLRRLDSELFKFKCELEADNNGITEILEKRSLEMDNNTSSAATALLNVMNINQKENRYYGTPSAPSNLNHSSALSVGSSTSLGAANSINSISLPATPTTNKERYRIPKVEKRRESNSTNLASAVPEKRPNLVNNLATPAPTVPVMRPITPNVATHGIINTNNIASNTTASTTSATPAAPTAVSYNLQQIGGSATNAIAAAASQAIVATQQMQQGRRTASLKASYEAIHGAGGGPTEFWISRDIANAATAATQQTLPTANVVERKQKKKTSTNMTHSSAVTNPTTPSSTLSLASSSSSVSVDSLDMLPSTAAAAAASANVGVPNISISNSPSTSTQAANRAATASTLATVNAVTTSTSVAAATDSNSSLVVEQTTDGEWPYDPNEPRYCTCNQVSYGDMVACDNDACPYEWFHYPCVGITQPPKGKWYCPKCTASMRRRGNRKN